MPAEVADQESLRVCSSGGRPGTDPARWLRADAIRGPLDGQACGVMARSADLAIAEGYGEGAACARGGGTGCSTHGLHGRHRFHLRPPAERAIQRAVRVVRDGVEQPARSADAFGDEGCSELRSRSGRRAPASSNNAARNRACARRRPWPAPAWRGVRRCRRAPLRAPPAGGRTAARAPPVLQSGLPSPVPTPNCRRSRGFACP
ncbi:hypothetical protein FQR65_LT20059 [Abscondita terminalis]|nr:hypothetical protein FQR65_LT20059 [Abscondita terminalis]